MKPLEVAREARIAETRIRPHVRETPLEASPELGEPAGASVYCKLENLQHTGSFKVRGAMNKLLSMTPEERARGVVAASSGNHGAATAYGAGKLGTRAVVFVPEEASRTKVEAIERLGAELRRFGRDVADTEAHARAYARRHSMGYVPPYNDPQIVAGQGTIGVELERQLAGIDAVFVTVGGGGLISGIAGYLKSVHPALRIVGCWPENSAVMLRSLEARRILELPSLPTLSDGSAGGVEPDSITFDLCRALIDERVTVTEEEIAASVRSFLGAQHMLVEGAAGVALAAYRKTQERYRGMNVVVVVCGANIDLDTLKGIL